MFIPAILADFEYPTIRQGVVIEQLDAGPFADWAGAPAMCGQIPEAFAAMRFCHGLCSFR
jgi:hypothetical protein